MKHFFGLMVFGGILGLAGCGDKPVPKATAPAVAQPPIAVQAQVDSLGPRYEVTLAEGIDFKRQGYPNFLAEVRGVSENEPWGRWSDGKLIIFKFKQSLPKEFSLVLQGGAFGPNVGKTFEIQIGSVKKDLVFSSDPFTQLIKHRILFKLNESSDTIQITVPEPSQPSNSDSRKLGVGMTSLKIEN